MPATAGTGGVSGSAGGSVNAGGTGGSAGTGAGGTGTGGDAAGGQGGAGGALPAAFINRYDGGRATTTTLDPGWKFHLGDTSGAEAIGFDDSSWSSIDVPHD